MARFEQVAVDCPSCGGQKFCPRCGGSGEVPVTGNLVADVFRTVSDSGPKMGKCIPCKKDPGLCPTCKGEGSVLQKRRVL